MTKQSQEQLAQKLINSWKLEPGSYSIYVQDLKSGEVYQENPDTIYHPASLLKLFVAVMASELLEDSEEKERALKASLRDSDNDALAYLVDELYYHHESHCNTEEENHCERLSPSLRAKRSNLNNILQKRQAITKYFTERGYSSQLRLHNKCFSFDYYGTEKQILEELGPNQITINDAAKIMLEIYNKHPKLLEYMQRNLDDQDDYQAQNFIGKSLEAQTFYSKAGWNSKVKHDCCITNGAASFIFTSK